MNRDIEKLSIENTDLQRQVDAANNQKLELQQKNRGLNENHKRLKAHNEDLGKQKIALQQELKMVKDELASLMDKAE